MLDFFNPLLFSSWDSNKPETEAVDRGTEMGCSKLITSEENHVLRLLVWEAAPSIRGNNKYKML